MVIYGASEASESADRALADASSAQSALAAEAISLRAALDALHGRQSAFEASVKAQARLLRALPPSHPALLDLRHRLTSVSRHLTPAPGGAFVQLFLGSLNVRFMRRSDRRAFKADYEKLKQRLAPVFVLACCACLYFEENRWLHMLLQLALATYYVTLAIRENILLVNGSNIKAWWIAHHYLTMLTGVLLLTWPNNQTYARFRNGFHFYGLYNAILQIFQTRYQIARLYTLRSLGMAGEMDVSNSDSTQIHWSETMKLLLPLIVFGLFLQLWQGISLLRIYSSSPHELQILLLGLLLLVLFVGNLMTTSLVVFEKNKASPTHAPLPARPFEPKAMDSDSTIARQTSSDSSLLASAKEPTIQAGSDAQAAATSDPSSSAAPKPPQPLAAPPSPQLQASSDSDRGTSAKPTPPPPPPPPPPFRPFRQKSQ